MFLEGEQITFRIDYILFSNGTFINTVFSVEKTSSNMLINASMNKLLQNINAIFCGKDAIKQEKKTKSPLSITKYDRSLDVQT